MILLTTSCHIYILCPPSSPQETVSFREQADVAAVKHLCVDLLFEARVLEYMYLIFFLHHVWMYRGVCLDFSA